MATTTAPQTESASDLPVKQYDAIIIGAGVTGIYQLYRLRQLGLSVRAFEYGSGVGGTWYWNRYPGCCFDSESESYGYFFSEELFREWEWGEHFAKQPETEKYLNHVVDKFDLRKDIQLDSEVVAAHWDDEEKVWEIELQTGERARARFLIAAIGILSAPAAYVPPFEGLDEYEGEWYHPAHWPKEEVSFEGRRVGIVGTGSTGVQITEQAALTAKDLYVFQRTPTYIGPLHNKKVTPEKRAEWNEKFADIVELCTNSPAGYPYLPDMRNAMDVPKEERWEFYEYLWGRPGFEKWLGNFWDITLNPEANRDFADFIRSKIRPRIKDPELAEKLLPSVDLAFGSRRIPLETTYYDVFNQDNVHLVDLRETPLQRITKKGIETSEGEIPLDIIVFATGFDSFTGGFTRIDIRGRDGKALKDKWEAEGPKTTVNLTVAGFPNFFTQVPRAFVNFPRCSQVIVDFVTDTLAYMKEHDYNTIEPTQEKEDAWVEHMNSFSDGKLFASADSWFNGGNIPGKNSGYLIYANSLPGYRTELEEVIAADFEGFELE